MNHALRILLSLVLLLGVPAALADDEPLSARELFGKSLVKQMKISPDGKHVALTYEEGSEVKLAVMNLSNERIVGGFEFGDNMHVLNFWWGSDERVVMSVGEVTGNLDNLGRPGALYAANYDGARRQQIFGQNLSGFQVLDPLPDDDRNILIARYHAADGGEPKGNLLDMFDGDLDFLGDQPVDPDMAGLVADNDGELRGAVAVKRGDAFDDVEIRLYVKIADEWESVDLDSERQRPSVNFLGFSADNEQVYFSSNHDMPSGDRMGVFRFDLSSRQSELIYRHDIVDTRGLLRTPRGTVMGAWASFGPADYSLFDDQVEALPEDARMLAGLLNAFPDDNVFVTSSTRDGGKAIVFVTGDRNPGDFYLFDTEDMQLQFLSASFPNLDKEKLVEMEPVRIEARDGLVLNAYLTRPANEKDDLPLILNVHGGPFGPYDRWGFNPEPQFFAQHGYATLQVNFRGSGNRGTDFQRAGWREWGGKMQDDLTDAVRWAIDEGIADPERVCIYGGSYGGYATLMGLIKTPDLYQCGVGYVGVYDLPWFWSGDGSDNDSAQSRDARRFRAQYMEAAVGENAESLRPVSPVHNVDKIEADLYIVHGGSDVRVPIGHAERLRDALDEIGKDYGWMVKDEEGHGFYDVDNRVDLYTSMLAFFDRHIGESAARATASVDAP